MHSLTPYNDTAAGLSDLLDWAALMDDGIVQGKSGALLAGWFYRGQDIASSTADERNYITHRINATLARLGGGWSIWHDAVRMPAAAYPAPSASHFPDPISDMIDRERRAQFLAEGAHFESGVSRMWGDQAASGDCRTVLGVGSNRLPKPDPNAPL
jgi:type IV secretion system protein TrbE